MKMSSWLVSTKSKKDTIGLMLLSDICSLDDHTRFGPNTTARFEAVILLRSLQSITLTKEARRTC